MAVQQEGPGGQSEPISATKLPDCPYIGLRPYSENERTLFFGREQDAQFLVNKILSAPLTLVYGMSGVGKSSLLRARVVPDLRSPEVADALVVYLFDCWTEPDIEKAIKEEIANAVGLRENAPSPSDTLLDWARHANNELGKSLVLILDQFEQFLLLRAGHLDPLRRELAALVRAKADAYVVLALREEFLASLEVFTHDIVKIYDSMYRLEHLSDEGAREAIVCPAQKYGVAVEPDLANALITDVKAPASTEVVEGIGSVLGEASIELPILQIVCQQLWKNRDPASPASLTKATYDDLDQRTGIIATYVAELTRGLKPDERDDAAAILHWLAPRSGLKRTYMTDELIEATGLPAERVSKLLRHFEKNYVLRPRPTAAGARYELHHDAFAKVLRQWIDECLADRRRREKRRTLLKVASGIGAFGLLLLAVFGFVRLSVQEHREEAQRQQQQQVEAIKVGNIDKAIEQLGNPPGNLAEQRAAARQIDLPFRESAEWTWKRIQSGADPDAELRDLEDRFTARNPLLGRSREDFIMEGSCSEEAALTEPSTSFGQDVDALDVQHDQLKEPAVLVYNPTHQFNRAVLRCYWNWLSSLFRQSKWPIVLPMRIGVVADDHAARDTVTLWLGHARGAGAAEPTASDPSVGVVSLKIPTRPHDAVIRDRKQLPEPLRSFFTRNELFLPRDAEGTGLLSVTSLPRWVYPLLRVSGVSAMPAEAAIITALGRQLLTDERPALTQEAVDYLLEQTAETAPETVREAMNAARGPEGVRAVLLAIGAQLDNKMNLIFEHFDLILDALASYPGAAPQDAAEKALRDLRSLSIHLPSSLNPHPAEALYSAPKSELSAEYYLTPADMPELLAPVRVELGTELVPCISDGGHLREGVIARLDKMRRIYLEGFGVTLPGIRFRTAERQMRPDSFAIEIAGRSTTGPFFGPIATKQEDCLAGTVDAVAMRLKLARVLWITSENIKAALDKLTPSQVEWLQDRYSLTDLKLLARATIAPDQQDILEIRLDEANDLDAGKTVRDLPRLLASLMFWREACARPSGGFSSDCVVEGLRRTQAARFAGHPAAPASDSKVFDAVAGGIAELFGSDGGTDQARETFADAVQENAEQAELAFLSEFPKTAAFQEKADALRETVSACLLNPGAVLDAKPLDAQDRKKFLAVFDENPEPSEEIAVPLKLCLLRDDLQSSRDEATARLDELLLRDPDTTKNWRAEEAYATGLLALKAHEKELWRADADFAPTKRAIERMLRQAFARWGLDYDTKSTEGALSEALKACGKASGQRWCLSVLQDAVEEFGRPTRQMQVTIGVSLAEQGNAEEARRALDIFRKSEHAQSPDDKDVSRITGWLVYGRALANLKLARAGDPSMLQNGEAQLRHLARDLSNVTDEKGWPARTDVALLRIDVAEQSGTVDEADRLLDEQPKDSSLLAQQQFRFLLRRGQLAEAKAIVERAKHLDESTQLFLLGLADFLDGAPDVATALRQVLNVHHEYESYIRLLLYVTLKREGRNEEAKKVLTERRSEVDPATRVERLRDGDIAPWRDMLVHYYLGELKLDELRNLIGDPAKFEQSPLAGTEQSAAEFLAELFFYDALLQSVTGDSQTQSQRERDSLHQVVASNGVSTYEFVMAGYMLRSLEASH
jgi:hypothetical protein